MTSFYLKIRLVLTIARHGRHKKAQLFKFLKLILFCFANECNVQLFCIGHLDNILWCCITKDFVGISQSGCFLLLD
jgi:hypothetical protein